MYGQISKKKEKYRLKNVDRINEISRNKKGIYSIEVPFLLKIVLTDLQAM